MLTPICDNYCLKGSSKLGGQWCSWRLGVYDCQLLQGNSATQQPSAFEQFRKHFTEIHADSVSLYRAICQKNYADNCHNLDTNTHSCYGKRIPNKWRKTVLRDTLGYGFLFAISRVQWQNGVEIFIAHYTELQEPHPGVVLITFLDGIFQDELLVSHIHLPLDHLYSEKHQAYLLQAHSSEICIAVAHFSVDHYPAYQRSVMDSSVYSIQSNGLFSRRN